MLPDEQKTVKNDRALEKGRSEYSFCKKIQLKILKFSKKQLELKNNKLSRALMAPIRVSQSPKNRFQVELICGEVSNPPIKLS